MNKPDQIILADIHEVKRQTGFKSSTTIYNKMAREGFPRPIPAGTRTRRWITAEVEAWIQSKIEARGA